ncbi:DUF1674 domain-containing protein [Alphaproteobacteria bacterium]|nr:DUF1674 domain-containing protein [Alphaproteobacteria bacterium]
MERDKKKPSTDQAAVANTADAPPSPDATKLSPTELHGPKGPEPTRYGDWEQKGRCTDF